MTGLLPTSTLSPAESAKGERKRCVTPLQLHRVAYPNCLQEPKDDEPERKESWPKHAHRYEQRRKIAVRNGHRNENGEEHQRHRSAQQPFELVMGGWLNGGRNGRGGRHEWDLIVDQRFLVAR